MNQDNQHGLGQPPPPGYGQGPPPRQEAPVFGQGQPSPEARRQRDERTWGMLCHLAAFACYVGVPLGSVVGPLIVWLIKKDEYPFVDDQGKQSLNFHISLVIYWIAAVVICLPLCFVLIGFLLLIPLGIALWIVDVVCTITAAVRANKGVYYRYPLAIPFLK